MSVGCGGGVYRPFESGRQKWPALGGGSGERQTRKDLLHRTGGKPCGWPRAAKAAGRLYGLARAHPRCAQRGPAADQAWPAGKTPARPGVPCAAPRPEDRRGNRLWLDHRPGTNPLAARNHPSAPGCIPAAVRAGIRCRLVARGPGCAPARFVTPHVSPGLSAADQIREPREAAAALVSTRRREPLEQRQPRVPADAGEGLPRHPMASVARSADSARAPRPASSDATPGRASLPALTGRLRAPRIEGRGQHCPARPGIDRVSGAGQLPSPPASMPPAARSWSRSSAASS
jgi:hypothetical protein